MKNRSDKLENMNQKNENIRCTISQLKEGMSTVDLIATVKWKGKIRDVATKFGNAPVCSVIIEDETGKINLNLWRDQINEAEVGSEIRITNGFVRIYRDSLELNVGIAGEVSKVERNTKSEKYISWGRFSDSC